jgi:hypothetical protein
MKDNLYSFLNTFVIDLNSRTKWNFDDKSLLASGELFAQSLKKLFSEEKREQRLHVSKLGLPGISQLDQVFPIKQEHINDHQVSQLYTFFKGFVFEAKVIAFLGEYCTNGGVKYTFNETLKHGDIEYHPDFIFQMGKEKAIVDTKSLNAYYHKQFLGKNLNDRGYLTQLGLYMHFQGIENGYFIVESLDASPYYVSLVHFSKEEIQPYVDEGLKTLQILKNVASVKEFVETFEVPEPEPHFIRNKSFVFPAVPANMRYCPYNHILYELGKVDGSTIPEVLSIKPKEEIVRCLKTFLMET